MTTDGPVRPARLCLTSQPALLAVGLLLSAFAAFILAGIAVSPPAAHAAGPSVNQCNNVGPGPGGATTGMTCTVVVHNTISHGHVSSTTTVTRLCSLDPCTPGNGTFTTASTSLVTDVKQCNGSGNDAAHPTTCTVTILNSITADTPGAQPVLPVTVNQCVGSGQGGGGSTVGCDPTPASVTGATITQCNGSGNGGGGTVTCTVGSTSKVSSAIPVKVNQCNGTGNPGGSVVTCRTTITTTIIAAATATPTPSATPTPTPTSTGISTGPPTTDNGTSDHATSEVRTQIAQVPSGGVETGGGAGAPSRPLGPVALGGALLLVAALASALLGARVGRRKS